VFLSQSLYHQTKNKDDDTAKATLRFYLQANWAILALREKSLCISFPLAETLTHQLAVQASVSQDFRPSALSSMPDRSAQAPLIPTAYPPNMSMMVCETFPFVSVRNWIPNYVNPLIPAWFGNQERGPRTDYPPNAPEELIGASIIEYSQLCKLVMFCYLPAIGRILEEDTMREEYFQIPQGAVPSALVATLVSKCEILEKMRPPGLSEYSRALALYSLSALLYSDNKLPQSHAKLLEAVIIFQQEVVHDMVLVSSAPLAPPYLMISCWILLQYRDLDTYETLADFLRHFANIGYTNCRTGLVILDRMKANIIATLAVPYTPINPPSFPLLYSGPKRPMGIPCPPYPGENSNSSGHSGSMSPDTDFQFEADPQFMRQPSADSEGSPDQMGEEQTMDVFYNMLSPKGDKSVYPELEYLMRGGNFEVNFR